MKGINSCLIGFIDWSLGTWVFFFLIISNCVHCMEFSKHFDNQIFVMVFVIYCIRICKDTHILYFKHSST